MCLELLHVLSVWELVTLYAAWELLFIFSSTEQYPSCWRETYLWTVVLSQFSFIIASIKFNLPENSLPGISYRSNGINRIVLSHGNWRVADTLDPGFFRTVHVKQFMSTVLHSHSVCQDNTICSTCNHDIILLAPSDTLDFTCVSCESHSCWILTGIKLKQVK